MNDIKDMVEKFNINKLNDLKGKKVLLRLDLNVSLGNNKTVDPGEDWRILKSLRTINFLREKGASIIILSHIGRDKSETLKPVFEYIGKFINLGFLPYINGDLVIDYISKMSDGSIVMMENVRKFDEEKENDISYLNDVVSLCDLYVNDAFSVSHRKHASVFGITKVLPSYFGLQFIDEIKYLTDFLKHNEGIKTLILGGAKFGTKLDLLKKIIPSVDYVLVGGAIANLFLRERGFNIGKSFVDDVDISSIKNDSKIILPIDYIDEHGDIASIDDVNDENIILDIGHETIKLFENIIDYSSAIMWNGPMGKYEDGYSDGSIKTAEAISHSNAFSVTGGGDTSTVILENNLEKSFNFISTGGGAMLSFLVNETLPCIDVILNKKED